MVVETSAHIKSILQRIPAEPGVYQYLDDAGTIIYVGKAKNLKNRVSSYFHQEHEWKKTRQLVSKIRDIRYVVVGSEQDAFLLENNLIKQYQPHYNILLKDGKSYPSICITREPYPRVFKTRKILKGAGEYYGPYSYGNTVDLVIELIHQLYPLRTCRLPLKEGENDKYRVCLKYHLHSCCGVCAGKVSGEEYRAYIEEAKKIIKGDAHQVSKLLEKQMMEKAAAFEYEQAGEIKRKIELIELFRSKTVITNTTLEEMDVFGYDEQDDHVYISILHIHNGSIVQGQTLEYRRQMGESREEMLAHGMLNLREEIGSSCKDVLVPFIPEEYDATLHYRIATAGDKKKLLDLAQKNVAQYKQDRLKQDDKLNPDQRATRILSRLQELLGLEQLPMHIDSFDNSHIQGEDMVSGCIVWRKAKPCKSEYKRYRIRGTEVADDYAAMREAVRRRYSDMVEAGEELPQLIIADGGSAQMNAIREVVELQLGLHIPIAGLKKDEHHRTNVLLYGNPAQEIGLKVTDEVFRLLVNIQDEVHRYAISYHQMRRSKRQTESELDDIQGVGPATKRKILQYFRSVSRARTAEKDEWTQLLGNSLGSRCYDYFSAKISR